VPISSAFERMLIYRIVSYHIVSYRIVLYCVYSPVIFAVNYEPAYFPVNSIDVF